MKTLKKAAVLLLMTAVAIGLFSFTENPGGESFEVFLNGKLMISQHVMQKETATLAIDPRAERDEIKVTYNHCGQTGKDRTVTITNAQNKVLKTFHFADAASMTFTVKDLGLTASSAKTNLNLVYASKELPKGRLLAAITLSKNTQASL